MVTSPAGGQAAHPGTSGTARKKLTLPQIKAGTLTSFEVDVYKDYSNANAAPVEPLRHERDAYGG